MAENARVRSDEKGDTNQKSRTKQQISEPLIEQRRGWDKDLLSLTETPFYPQMDKHTAFMASVPPGPPINNFVMHLQQTYGNRYVQRLVKSINIQPKLTVNAPNDIYEQEADRVADKVMKAVTSPAQRQPEEEEEPVQMMPLLQRQEEEELQMIHRQPIEEEEELQAKSLIQRQEEEKELAQAKSSSGIQRQEEEELQMEAAESQEEEELQMQPVEEEEEEEHIQAVALQRQEDEEELQTQIDKSMPSAVSIDIESRINSVRGSGHPLSEAIREPIEQAMGADFNDVRVHTDSEAGELSQQLGAKAFTTGRDIFFRKGEYDPTSGSGQKLLAHELTHVVQQQQGRVQPTMPMMGKVEMNDDSGLEKEADAMGAMAMQQPRLEAISSGTENRVTLKGTNEAENTVQLKFAGALEKLTLEKLEAILPSYEFLNEGQVQTIRREFKKLEDSRLVFWSVPQLLQKVLGLDPKVITEKVKKSLGKRAGSQPTTKQMVTLHRGDGRPPKVIKAAGGFFGRGFAPITIEHARQIIEKDWGELNNSQKMAWAQNWKAQTKAPHEHVPYVATGEESQKAGYDYTINVPLKFETVRSALVPKVGADAWPISSATILAIKMRGGEVIFLTGIPWKYITPPSTATSKPPPRPRSKPPPRPRSKPPPRPRR